MSNRRDADVVLIAANLKAHKYQPSAEKDRSDESPPAVYTLLLLAFGLLLSFCYFLIATSAETIADGLATRLHPSAQAAGTSSGRSQADLIGARLPDYRADSIWLVEKKESYELYSNGGRINTAYEVESHPRAYYARLRGAAAESAELRHEPIGIVYHTSESDIVPFVESNTRLIRTRTQGLLDHVRRRRAYNYVIDRFGGIYRTVPDGEAANHAGHSVWGDAEHIYVGLNESFIGICFESSSTAGSIPGEPDDQLTEAQLMAGRALTAILRSRYQIPDANCTTHALVSVNPGNMMVAYHRDWMRDFPFEAMGLSDKYRVPLASITEFGFDCDLPLVRKLGHAVWPGVAPAKAAFKERAQREETSLDLLRDSLRERYLAEIEMERQLHQSSPTAETDESPPQ